MKVRFWHSDKPRERILAEAFLAGVRLHGDDVDARPLGQEVTTDCDVAAMVGVKSRELFQAHGRAGIHLVYLDKGYDRHGSSDSVRAWEYWRVAVDAHQPTAKYRSDLEADRRERFGWQIKPWRATGRQILIAGSSQKYHDFYALRDPTAWAGKLVKQIAGHSSRPIVYRPKPSWSAAVPIDGTHFSGPSESIVAALAGAHALVTHGSNACFEAILLGVPCIVLGDAVAKPISSTAIEEIEAPRLASDEERSAWLNFLAYQQWTLAEMASGEMWKRIRPQIYG